MHWPSSKDAEGLKFNVLTWSVQPAKMQSAATCTFAISRVVMAVESMQPGTKSKQDPSSTVASLVYKGLEVSRQPDKSKGGESEGEKLDGDN
jgi:hypothetical protein